MEGIRKSRIEMIVETYEKAGKVKTYSVEESENIFEAIDERMRKISAEVKRLDFASRVAAEKIILATSPCG
ncbi:MAG: hypothetical protein V2B19_30705 [Pseudomonadota bacterium]